MSPMFTVIDRDGEQSAFGSEEIGGNIYDYDFGPDDELFGKKVSEIDPGIYDGEGKRQDA